MGKPDNFDMEDGGTDTRGAKRHSTITMGELEKISTEEGR
jgi:hypothetical protein